MIRVVSSKAIRQIFSQTVKNPVFCYLHLSIFHLFHIFIFFFCLLIIIPICHLHQVKKKKSFSTKHNIISFHFFFYILIVIPTHHFKALDPIWNARMLLCEFPALHVAWCTGNSRLISGPNWLVSLLLVTVFYAAGLKKWTPIFSALLCKFSFIQALYGQPSQMG